MNTTVNLTFSQTITELYHGQPPQREAATLWAYELNLQTGFMKTSP